MGPKYVPPSAKGLNPDPSLTNHWYVRFVPVAVTLKFASVNSQTAGEGVNDVITGRSLTIIVAVPLRLGEGVTTSQLLASLTLVRLYMVVTAGVTTISEPLV